MDRYKDKVVIVTGAGSGIGAAVARRFAQEGATVVLAGRTREKLEAVAAGLSGARVRPTDVSDPGQAEALIEDTARTLGRIDVLVNNAGIAAEGDVTQVSVPDWQRVLATNLGGVFLCSRAAIGWLARSGGSIVNVASVSGMGGDWALAAYDASKGGIVNLTRAMAMDHARQGVRVNAVSPTFTRTPMTADMQDDPEVLARFRERIPMGRPAEPEEIAAVVAFLASADAGFVTGVNLPVDGGLSASNGQPRM